MNEGIQSFVDKFQVNKLSIVANDHWVWSLRPGQCTLGAGVLSLRTYAERLSDITPEAGQDLAAIIKIIERVLSRAFQYDKINYLMLMMVDAHVHYHVVPRYARPIEMFDRSWTDRGWPTLPDLAVGQGDADMLLRIREVLLQHL